ncbi:MAG: hypothetical protein SFZ03_01845 [Candidatus Melainabacteria bacterium]|nr:hypothetical protein [Candidatus Melainabacteria bacterium]
MPPQGFNSALPGSANTQPSQPLLSAGATPPVGRLPMSAPLSPSVVQNQPIPPGLLATGRQAGMQAGLPTDQWQPVTSPRLPSHPAAQTVPPGLSPVIPPGLSPKQQQLMQQVMTGQINPAQLEQLVLSGQVDPRELMDLAQKQMAQMSPQQQQLMQQMMTGQIDPVQLQQMAATGQLPPELVAGLSNAPPGFLAPGLPPMGGPARVPGAVVIDPQTGRPVMPGSVPPGALPPGYPTTGGINPLLILPIGLGVGFPMALGVNHGLEKLMGDAGPNSALVKLAQTLDNLWGVQHLNAFLENRLSRVPTDAQQPIARAAMRLAGEVSPDRLSSQLLEDYHRLFQEAFKGLAESDVPDAAKTLWKGAIPSGNPLALAQTASVALPPRELQLQGARIQQLIREVDVARRGLENLKEVSGKTGFGGLPLVGGLFRTPESAEVIRRKLQQEGLEATIQRLKPTFLADLAVADGKPEQMKKLLDGVEEALLKDYRQYEKFYRRFEPFAARVKQMENNLLKPYAATYNLYGMVEHEKRLVQQVLSQHSQVLNTDGKRKLMDSVGKIMAGELDDQLAGQIQQGLQKLVQQHGLDLANNTVDDALKAAIHNAARVGNQGLLAHAYHQNPGVLVRAFLTEQNLASTAPALMNDLDDAVRLAAQAKPTAIRPVGRALMSFTNTLKRVITGETANTLLPGQSTGVFGKISQFMTQRFSLALSGFVIFGLGGVEAAKAEGGPFEKLRTFTRHAVGYGLGSWLGWEVGKRWIEPLVRHVPWQAAIRHVLPFGLKMPFIRHLTWVGPLVELGSMLVVGGLFQKMGESACDLLLGKPKSVIKAEMEQKQLRAGLSAGANPANNPAAMGMMAGDQFQRSPQPGLPQSQPQPLQPGLATTKGGFPAASNLTSNLTLGRPNGPGQSPGGLQSNVPLGPPPLSSLSPDEIAGNPQRVLADRELAQVKQQALDAEEAVTGG